MKDRGWQGLPEFSQEMYKERYFTEGEEYDGWVKRIAGAYADDEGHQTRIESYVRNYQFHPSTPISSNAGLPTRGLPISCYTNEVTDSKSGIFGTWEENNWLGAGGGGIGTNWSNVRGIGARVGATGKSSGIIPFIKVSDSTTLAVSQGGLRRASQAVYLDLSHPEILEFLDIRKPTGDVNRKSLNIHHGVTISDEFMMCVTTGKDYNLVDPNTKKIVGSVNAFELWKKILVTRMETGEPYLLFTDNVNSLLPDEYYENNMFVKTSNLCSEIMLHTEEGYSGVCCLTSMNLEYWDEYKDNIQFFEDIHRYTDNVLQSYIELTEGEEGHSATRRAAMNERSIGIGTMGFHQYLQSKGLPYGCLSSDYINKSIFTTIHDMFNETNVTLGNEKGTCPISTDHRNTHVTAVAPTASISTLCNLSSQGIDPRVANAYTAKTNIGSYQIRNKFLQQKLETDYDIKDMEAVWKSIVQHGGSVQHFDWMEDEDKEVYLTAYEIDQTWTINYSAVRAPWIDQGISTNLFLAADVDVAVLHNLHYQAWKKGVKSLYYLRSTALNRASVKSQERECLSCQ